MLPAFTARNETVPAGTVAGLAVKAIIRIHRPAPAAEDQPGW
jgi:hypothetical protein